MKLIVFLILFTSVVFAEDAKVLFVNGSVSYTDLNGETKSLERGVVLNEGHTIKAGEDSRVILKIEGHSSHRIDENTELLIEDLPYKFKDSDEIKFAKNKDVLSGQA